jgi:ribosomal protein S25
MSDSMVADDGSPFSAVEKKQRYPLPAAAAKQRKLLRPGPRVIFDEMIDRFRKDGREREVAVRQLAEACQISEGSVKNAIKTLVEKGFIVVVSRGTIDIKRKPSTYRLTMFACHGKDATHDYVVDVSEWRRAGKRNRSSAPMPAKVRLSFEVATEQLPDAVEALTPFTFESP